MRTSDFDYQLPPERIAQQAVEPRDCARLLYAGPDDERHLRVYDLPHLLRPGDLLVRNRSRVIPARLLGTSPDGGGREVLLIHPLEHVPDTWRCLIKGKVRPGSTVLLHGLACTVQACHDDGGRDLRFPPDCDVLGLCEGHGHIPLPPYIRRDDTPADRDRYQTVYADSPGSVAAPTAGLHFTPELLARLERQGIATAAVDLAIGPGTFKPVQCEQAEDHPIHAEHCTCPEETVVAVDACRAGGGRVIAVGTTVVRTLETAANPDGSLTPYRGWTSLYLYPPQRSAVVDGLLTNFHLPRSSLLMLVACFTGLERLHRLYQTAIATSYRFYSFGDAMLWLPDSGSNTRNTVP